MEGGASHIDLLKLSLLDLLGPTTTRAVPRRSGRVRIEAVPEADRDQRLDGRDWPANGTTMIGWKRLSNLELCTTDVLKRGVPGDLIETGVWRGGATILMRALLELHGVTDRAVWLADSFAGLPRPDSREYPADAHDRHHKYRFLVATEDEVRRNFERYGLLDDQVCFLPGWFQDTLPRLSGRQWALIRLDGDMYESTIVALESLYPGLSPGGYVLVDDYGAVAACRAAVEDFRSKYTITEELQPVDWTGVFWRKQG